MYSTKGLSELTEKFYGWQWCWKEHDDHVNIEKTSGSKKKNKSSIFLEKNPKKMLKFPCKLEQTSATVNTAELFSFFIGFMNYDRKHNALVVFWFLMFLFLIKVQLSIVCTGAIRYD